VRIIVWRNTKRQTGASIDPAQRSIDDAVGPDELRREVSRTVQPDEWSKP